MMETFGARAFPFIAFLDAEGKLIAKHRDVRALRGFQEAARRAEAFVEARRRYETTKDRVAKVDLDILKLDLDVDRMTLEKAQRAVRDLGELTEAQERSVEGLLASLEVKEMCEKGRGDEQAKVEAARRCFEMRSAGRVPVEFRARLDFWYFVSCHAERMRDVAVYEEAVTNLKEICAGDSLLDSWLKPFEARLSRLKGQ